MPGGMQTNAWCARMLFVLQETLPLTINGTGFTKDLEKGTHGKKCYCRNSFRIDDIGTMSERIARAHCTTMHNHCMHRTLDAENELACWQHNWNVPLPSAAQGHAMPC
jgi:hypothetical protein